MICVPSPLRVNPGLTNIALILAASLEGSLRAGTRPGALSEPNNVLRKLHPGIPS